MPEPKPHAPTPAYEAPSSRRTTSGEGSVEEQPAKHDPYAAFRFSAFGFYATGNLVSVIGRQMLTVC
ncbi:MAG: hypothetical protein H0T11_07230, partial [Chthoniobacterales bacterium]|nr:hypothetical protein [Chthoniobacterales bacterium]